MFSDFIQIELNTKNGEKTYNVQNVSIVKLLVFCHFLAKSLNFVNNI